MKTWNAYIKPFIHRHDLISAFLAMHIFILLFSNILANEKPLLCHCKSGWKFPAFHDYLYVLGLSMEDFENYAACDHVVKALIPFSSHTIDPGASGYLPPFRKSPLTDHRHWLGTDALGRDVLSGLIDGTRTAWVIGLLATLISMVPGVILGLMAGYWRNDRIRFSLASFFILLPLISLLAYEFFAINGLIHSLILKSIVCIFFIALTVFMIYLISYKLQLGNRKYTFPLDHIIFRTIDALESIPKLFLLMSMIVFFARPSLISLILMIALIRWSLFVIVTRSSTLKESVQNYVISAKNLGVSDWKIMTYHIWPNIRSEVLVTAVYTFGASILLESTLSFIGLGLKLESVSWGSILNEGRQYLPAWWLTVFPGITIFTLLWALNRMITKK